jgi:hypothetical protein
MRAIKLLILHSLPFGVGIILTNLFWQSNVLLLTIFLLMVSMIILKGKDRKVETFIFFYGIGAGAIVEIIGTSITGYQSFTKPELLGIPYWLLVSWGYGFILMKRISLIIGKGKAWL